MKNKLLVAILSLSVVLSFTGCQGYMGQSVAKTTAEEMTKETETNEEKEELAEEAETDEKQEEAYEEADEVKEEAEVEEDTAVENEAEMSEEVIISQEELVNMSSPEFAQLLKFGWNLGNTLDANSVKGMDSEICWNQPRVTQELISYVKEVGFTTIRIPVSWGNHVDENYRIDDEWMERVKEIVDYAYNENLYVIINSHHDNDYYYPSEENYDNAEKYITTIWAQIAEEFKNYDNHLVFESMNEPRLSGTDMEWWFEMGNPTGKAAIERICKLNQAFVDTVRTSGGNNDKRFLMVPSYAANVDFAFNSSFSMPEDSAEKLMLSIHAYTPYDFAGNPNGYSDWDGSKNYEFNFMGKLKALFVNEGYGVVIGEFGATNKGNDKARITWGKNYTGKAQSFGIPCIIWDNGATGIGEENFGVINRDKLELSFPDLFDAYIGPYLNN